MTNFADKKYIGAKVFDPRYGNGRIVEVKNKDITKYPVWVSFESLDRCQYTISGSDMETHTNPILCWGHREPLDQGEPPKIEPKPLNFDGTPVWAYVGCVKNSWEHEHKSLVIAKTLDGKFVAIDDGRNNLNCNTISFWEYAWRLTNDQ